MRVWNVATCVQKDVEMTHREGNKHGYQRHTRDSWHAVLSVEVVAW